MARGLRCCLFTRRCSPFDVRVPRSSPRIGAAAGGLGLASFGLQVGDAQSQSESFRVFPVSRFAIANFALPCRCEIPSSLAKDSALRVLRNLQRRVGSKATEKGGKFLLWMFERGSPLFHF